LTATNHGQNSPPVKHVVFYALKGPENSKSKTGANQMPSVYEVVTDKIIKQLESGVAPWRKPWTCQTPANLVTQKEYRGLNVFTLATQGFASRFWLTFNQATKLGGRIRKGEKSSPVIFWNVGEEQETTTQDGKKETSRPFLLRYYSVFNFAQTEGIDIPASLLQETRINDPIATCEQIVANMPNRRRSSNPTKHGTHPAATWSVCQHAASSIHRKSFTPPNSTNWPTAVDTQSACTGRTSINRLILPLNPTPKRNSSRK
jgi:hypothetical protein